MEAALDDLVDGTVQAVVVDEVALTSYKRRKPGRFAKLKELKKSPVFPAAVVAYRPDKWNDTDLKTMKDALLNAHQNPEGRQLLTMWKLTGFAPNFDGNWLVHEVIFSFTGKGASRMEIELYQPSSPSITNPTASPTLADKRKLLATTPVTPGEPNPVPLNFGFGGRSAARLEAVAGGIIHLGLRL